MEPPVFTRSQRRRALQFAVLGNVLPIALATIDDFESHRAVFFVGAAIAVLAPIVVVLATPRYPLLRTVFAFGGLPALTMLQAYSGGVGSPYAVLLIMAAIWFGIQASDRELIAGLAVIAACCYGPMLIFGPPAYPLDWLQATLVVVVAAAVTGSLATLSRETWRLTANLRKEATLDELTGLLNRRGWSQLAERELGRARRRRSVVGLVMIDLDGLKNVNDTMGHDEGDRLLRETGGRMRAAFRAEDVIARLGGDEFTALLTDTSADEAFGAVERLRSVTPGDGAFSAGVAIAAPDETLDELLRRGDLALYEAKSLGGRQSTLAAPPIPLAGG